MLKIIIKRNIIKCMGDKNIQIIINKFNTYTRGLKRREMDTEGKVLKSYSN